MTKGERDMLLTVLRTAGATISDMGGIVAEMGYMEIADAIDSAYYKLQLAWTMLGDMKVKE